MLMFHMYHHSLPVEAPDKFERDSRDLTNIV